MDCDNDLENYTSSVWLTVEFLRQLYHFAVGLLEAKFISKASIVIKLYYYLQGKDKNKKIIID